jgi:hypothetical protein
MPVAHEEGDDAVDVIGWYWCVFHNRVVE